MILLAVVHGNEANCQKQSNKSFPPGRNGYLLSTELLSMQRHEHFSACKLICCIINQITPVWEASYDQLIWICDAITSRLELRFMLCFQWFFNLSLCAIWGKLKPVYLCWHCKTLNCFWFDLFGERIFRRLERNKKKILCRIGLREFMLATA